MLMDKSKIIKKKSFYNSNNNNMNNDNNYDNNSNINLLTVDIYRREPISSDDIEYEKISKWIDEHYTPSFPQSKKPKTSKIADDASSTISSFVSLRPAYIWSKPKMNLQQHVKDVKKYDAVGVKRMEWYEFPNCLTLKSDDSEMIR